MGSVWLGAKIYRVGILMYGKKHHIKNWLSGLNIKFFKWLIF